MALVTFASSDSCQTTNQPERKQVTVLFCDIVEYTSWSATMDPEDLADRVHQFQSACQQIAKKYQGHIANFLGDGILILFGYPTGNEFSVQDAIHTALELIDLVANARNPFALRIGISTSLVVIGQRVDHHRDELIFGEAPNLAARLQTIAKPNQILVSQRSRRLAGPVFDFHCLGQHKIKGFREPIRIWQVKPRVRKPIYLKRFRSPFIGRNQELETLSKHYQRSLVGETQIVHIYGNPGVGKSRLMRVFEKTTRHPKEFRIRIHCTKATEHLLYSGIVDEIQRWLDRCGSDYRIAPSDRTISKAMTSLGLANDQDKLLFRHLIEHRDKFKTSPAMRQKVVSLLLSIVGNLTVTHGVFLSIEDLQWADTGTLEFVESLVNGARGQQLFVMLTSRCGWHYPWLKAPTTSLAILPLNEQASETIISKLFQDAHLPQTVKRGIVAQTDGIPLYIEEYCWHVLDQIRHKTTFGNSRSSPGQTVIPDALQDELNARLDPLGPFKIYLQIASVFGTEFQYRDFEQILRRNGLDPLLGIKALLDHRFLIRVNRPDGIGYQFRQVMVQQAAYQSLLNKRRHHYHRQIVNQLQLASRGLVQTHPHIFARHWGCLGEAQIASELWILAAKRAYKSGEVNIALDHVTKAIFFAAQTAGRDLNEPNQERIIALLRSQLSQGDENSSEELLGLIETPRPWPSIDALWGDLITQETGVLD